MSSRVLRLKNSVIKEEPDNHSPFPDLQNDAENIKKRSRSFMEEEDESSELEKKRRRNVMEKTELLKNLGILQTVNELNDLRASEKKNVEEEKRKRKEEREKLKLFETPLLPIRRSLRVAHQPAVSYDEVSLLAHSKERELKEIEKEKEREFVCDPEPMKPLSEKEEEDENEVKTSLTDLLPYLRACGSTKNTSEVSLDSYKKELRKLTLAPEKVKKIGNQKLYTLTVHPSESKTLVITGGDRGVVGFWDAGRADDAVNLFSPLDAPVYCVSVCNHNPSLVYCTSIEGVTRSCDLEKLQFQDIYVNSGKDCHTTHHSQLSPHVLMIACGDGSVKLVDVREPGKTTKVFKCHERSVRTVQRHPLKDHIFVTASRTCTVAIWDTRMAHRQKSLVSLAHPKAMKSAFFSPGGSLLLTTCNDNRLRVYETGYMDRPLRVVMNTEHNLFTGRFIRPFKATWHPLRDDVFIIGSLEAQRKVDIYGIHGLRIHALRSPNMTTILSNLMFHPTRDIVVGHNSSGRVHVFEKD